MPAPGPPTGDISAAFATALAFAPDGRLFYAERSGTIRVWQHGAAQIFAHVNTVTTERGGGYSERGLLGLAVSPHSPGIGWSTRCTPTPTWSRRSRTCRRC